MSAQATRSNKNVPVILYDVVSAGKNFQILKPSLYCRLLVSLYLLWTVFERMHQISIDCWHYNHNPYRPDINLC